MSYKYTAIIIEPRKHAALHFVLQNMLECLSNEWKIVFFHGLKNIEYFRNFVRILNANYENRIQLVQLNVDNLNQKTYSKLLATKSIIYDYINTEYFLIFQTDSIMIKSNAHLLNSFLDKDYDYVGAPWLICGYEPTLARDFIGNGGFSLRKTATMLKIIANHPWDENNEWHEDLYFTKKYHDIVTKKPSYDIAKTFCVDEIFCENTMACHRAWCHSHFNRFIEIYPECRILRDLQHEEEL